MARELAFKDESYDAEFSTEVKKSLKTPVSQVKVLDLSSDTVLQPSSLLMCASGGSGFWL